MSGDSSRGLALVQKALALQPDDYDTRKNLANILCEMERNEEAEPLYRAVLAQAPQDSSNHLNLSVVLRKLGDVGAARAAAEQALALDPAMPAAWLALANAHASDEQLEPAVSAYQQVLALLPDCQAAHDSLCRTLLRIEQASWWSRRRLPRTREAYRRWQQIVPGNSTARFMLEAIERGAPPARMPDQVVVDTFDAFAPDFDRHLRRLGYRGPELIAEALQRRGLRSDRTRSVLDAGCGTGLAGTILRPYAARLSGVDLSPRMLARARRTGMYDELVEAELSGWLATRTQTFDLIASADVLIYFGELPPLIGALAAALRPGGLLVVTVEEGTRPGFQLQPTGRYSHHRDTLRAALAGAGLIDIGIERCVLRQERRESVAGLLACARSG